MGTIAKGEITLSPVNDAYTVSITPASCTIRADFDGSNPNLANANGVITVKRGAKEVLFHVKTPHISTGGKVSYAQGVLSSVPFFIENIPSNVLDGIVSFDIETDDGFNYQTTVSFAFTIVRETTMLDWIQDWEGSKTKIGDSYIMTPKIFIGKKEDVCQYIEHETVDSYEESYEWIKGALTGVYIGPDLLDSKENGVGIYGYLQGKEIFHLNADGGLIGGWKFNEAGLQSSNGVVNILSEGSIFAQNTNSTTEYWGIYVDGHATFANGNVKFMADGSAEYAGKITSSSGSIGGWTITKNQIHSNRVVLDSKDGIIGIDASKFQAYNVVTGDVSFPSSPNGGVKMWYSSANDFGFAGWSNSQKVFSIGSVNMIAGWNFNHQAIWTGSESPYLSQGSFATNSDELTIAPNGIRSNKWYIDANGTARFVGGSVQFNTENAEMFGWKMSTGRFSAAHAALTSSSYWSGFFVSPANLTEVGAESLVNIISNSGGIYMYSDGANSLLRAYDTKGKLGFALQTNGYHTIGAWNFNHEAIYTGSYTPDSSTKFMSKADQMILSTSIGLIGYKWRLSADGSGSIAGGHISWDANGDITLDNSVKIAWANVTGTSAVTDKLTKIDANGIYTGTISADNITAGTISTANIKNASGTWYLNQDGSGCLANGNITWDKDGKLTIDGTIEADSGTIGGWLIENNKLKSQNGNTWLNGQTGEVRLKGTIQHSTGTSGNFSDVDLFSLPAITSPKSNAISMGEEETDIGKRCLLTNMSQYGSNGVYRILIRRFGWTHRSDGVRIQYNEGGEYYNIFPGETVEMTCFALNSGDKVMGNTVEGGGYWKITARYNREIARIVAMGSVTNTSSGATISGWTVGGTNLTVERSGTGDKDATYTIKLPEIFQYVQKLCILLTGVGTCQNTNTLPKATVVSHSQRTIVVRVSDDASDNAGSFNFVCYDINGWQFS